MKRKFMMLSLLISESWQPGNDIDVYFSLLSYDFKTLQEKRVETYNALLHEVFTLKIILLQIINDFPSQENLVGCTIKGYYPCLICRERTYSHILKHGRKNSYMGH